MAAQAPASSQRAMGPPLRLSPRQVHQPGQHGAESGQPGLFNRFAYVSNNQLKFTDPTGYSHHCEAFVEFGTCDGLDEFGSVNSAVSRQ